MIWHVNLISSEKKNYGTEDLVMVGKRWKTLSVQFGQPRQERIHNFNEESCVSGYNHKQNYNHKQIFEETPLIKKPVSYTHLVIL